jgi:predicted metal-dependent hydrolase
MARQRPTRVSESILRLIGEAVRRARRDDASRDEQPADVKVTFRKMEFGFEKGFDKYWHGGSPFVTCFWNAMSASFPAGERFFVEAVYSLRDRVDDRALFEELLEFARQEGHHSFQHTKFNNKVREQGFDMARYEQSYGGPLSEASRTLTPMQKLAVTLALEHFTAVVSRHMITNPEVLRDADPKVRALWLWHAAEELEHKSTCFDLYRRLGGRESTRIRALSGTLPQELYLVLRNTLTMLYEDGRLFDLPDLLHGLWYLFGPKGFISGMVPDLVTYLSPHFHPWELDDRGPMSELLAKTAGYIAGPQAVRKSPDLGLDPA